MMFEEIVGLVLHTVEILLTIASILITAVYSRRSFRLVKQAGVWRLFAVAVCLVGIHTASYILWDWDAVIWSALSLAVLAFLVIPVEGFSRKGRQV